MLSAEIIAIGSELLMPQFRDTNSLYLTEQLNAIGIPVVMKTIVGDDENYLEHAVRGAHGSHADSHHHRRTRTHRRRPDAEKLSRGCCSGNWC